MTAYADTSALLKRYVLERDSALAIDLLGRDEQLFTARHSLVELRRNLVRLLTPRNASVARRKLADDLETISIVELDPATCDLAATIAEQSGIRTLDALHLGAARRLGTSLTFVTFDLRQAQVAQSLGFTVAGA